MIMDKLGGKIGFVSTPGLGTTFYFDLEAHSLSARENPGTRRAARAS
jgi:signal transduction histidine kinase